jgi:hypothetical protein
MAVSPPEGLRSRSQVHAGPPRREGPTAGALRTVDPLACARASEPRITGKDGRTPHLVGELFGKVGLELAHRSCKSGPAVCDVHFDHVSELFVNPRSGFFIE